MKYLYLSSRWIVSGGLVLTLLSLVFCAESGFSQVALPIRTASPGHSADRLATFSKHALRLVRARKDGTPGMIVARPNVELPIFEPRSDARAVTLAMNGYAESFLRTLLAFHQEVSIENRGTVRTGIVWESSYSIKYSGIPLLERTAKFVAGAKNGKIIYIENTLPGGYPANFIPAFDPAKADSIVSLALQNEEESTYSREQPELVFVLIGASSRPQLAYQVIAQSRFHSLRFWVDAGNGTVLKIKDIDEYNSGSVKKRTMPQTSSSGKLTVQIHPQSPYDSLITVPLPNTTVLVNSQRTITDSSGAWVIPGILPPLFILTGFSNPAYSIEDTTNGTANSTLTIHTNSDTTLSWTDLNSNAAERDAYYHVGNAENYVLRLDSALRPSLQFQLTVNVNLQAVCNAFYNPEMRSVNFFHGGGGCSNTGEIADIVYHEFGHRVADIRYAESSGANIVDGSLSEGFADLFSAFMRDDPRIGIDFYGKGTALRNCNNTKKWPEDLNPDIHLTGEIIAGAFWDLRKEIGRDTAEKLFHEMEYLHPDGTDMINPSAMQDAFLSVLTALLMVDDTDNNLTNGTPHATQILSAFALHNIGLGSLITVNTSPIADQDTNVNGYRVQAGVRYSGQIGAIDTNAVVLFYSIDHWNTYTSIQMERSGTDSFSCTIPKQAAGSVVEYYVRASTIYPDAGSGYAPRTAPFTPFAFLVGYKQTFLDDAEQDRGWTLSDPNDNAVAGRWTRDIPYGTFSVPGDFIQQDSDHSPNGMACYLTGNLNAEALSRDISYDDVDSGFTTLTSPSYDLSKRKSPVIRFWYYYSNSAGSAPGINTWKILLSNDGGTSWKYLLDTRNSTAGWTPFLFKVSDYLLPTSNVQMRFIASDTVGAIVEAGVDDLEILESPEGASNVNRSNGPTTTLHLGNVHPNPVTRGLRSVVEISLRTSGHIVLHLKDVLGRIVQTPLDRYANAGTFDVSIPSSNLPSGIYWLQLETTDGERLQRFTVTH